MNFKLIDRREFKNCQNIIVPSFNDLSGLERFISAKEVKVALTQMATNRDEINEPVIEELFIGSKRVYLLIIPSNPTEKDFLKGGFSFGEIVRKKKIHNPCIGAMEDIFKTAKDSIYTKLFLDGFGFGVYVFDKYKTKREHHSTNVQIFSRFSSNRKRLGQILPEISEVIKNLNLVRDLVNMPPNVLTTDEFCKIAKNLGQDRWETQILLEEELKREDLNLILAVGGGSKNKPALLKMYYRGDKGSKKHIALVGKGVTFDSGGTNLKPTGSIETMKTDMAGAATALGLINLISSLKLPVNLSVYTPLVENIIGYGAYRPGDVITSKSGKTVEILNTDAEGRLVLADALSVAVEEKPDIVIDIATLTGACVVALGSHIAALFTNEENIVHKIYNISKNTGEDVCYLPLYEEYEKRIKGGVADIQNISKKKGEAGTIIAALFLKQFVGDTNWVHFDIAGTAFMEEKHPYFGENATGFGLRLLFEFIKSM